MPNTTTVALLFLLITLNLTHQAQADVEEYPYSAGTATRSISIFQREDCLLNGKIQITKKNKDEVSAVIKSNPFKKNAYCQNDQKVKMTTERYDALVQTNKRLDKLQAIAKNATSKSFRSDKVQRNMNVTQLGSQGGGLGSSCGLTSSGHSSVQRIAELDEHFVVRLFVQNETEGSDCNDGTN